MNSAGFEEQVTTTMLMRQLVMQKNCKPQAAVKLYMSQNMVHLIFPTVHICKLLWRKPLFSVHCFMATPQGHHIGARCYCCSLSILTECVSNSMWSRRCNTCVTFAWYLNTCTLLPVLQQYTCFATYGAARGKGTCANIC